MATAKKGEKDDGVMKKGLIGVNQNIVGSLRRPKAKEKDERLNRNMPVSWETSIRYMESETYKQNYGNYKVWELYRRNHWGQQHSPPFLTRVTCIGEDGYVKGSSPCALCRDRFLVPHYKNVKLLMQFISPWTGEVIEPRKTNLCQMKQEELLVAIYLAKEYGTISFHIPMKKFDYKLYYDESELSAIEQLPEEESIALEEEDPIMKKLLNIQEFGHWHKHSYISNP
ncbi:28S ribosomal protein S18b-like protein [Dinothrombium tinctorium]|uniref:Small ribosomal subunit protein mS40 n=1 Tax=Dinothrombium tinctorium TaxID=1965070 RepID=A0A443QHC7_9ACAR|nr:28S ribosomal protein S18b-like protein [Dinothrombium tinctorium]